jgi:hypothetical protein
VSGWTDKRLMVANSKLWADTFRPCVFAVTARCSQHSYGSESLTGALRPGPRNNDHGHCPLFTHPGAGLALKVGEAMAVARVVAGGAAVAVAPIFMAVGSTDIVGTTGDTYDVPVAESPDPPATFCRLESAGCVRTSMTAAMIALPPSPAENHVSRRVCIDYLQQRSEIVHIDLAACYQENFRSGQERFFELLIRLYVGDCPQSIGQTPFKWT